MKQYKIVASRGGQIIFEERVEATSPRDARRQMKERLGLRCLCGIVYAITEIPLELIREIVTMQMARVVSDRMTPPEVDLPGLISTAVNEITLGALEGIAARLEALESRRNGNPTKRREASSREVPTETRPTRFDPMNAPAESSVPAEEAVSEIPPEAAPEISSPPPAAERGDPERLRAILGPDWGAIQSHYLETRKVKQTAALFNVSINTLKARIRREGWGR